MDGDIMLWNICFLHKGTVLDAGGSQASFFMQAFTLTERSFINMSRDFGFYWLRLLIYIVVTICIGTIYLNVGTGYNSILARGACASFVLGFVTFMSIGGFPSFVEDMKMGMGSALETLCGQVYGAGQLNMLGIYLQRSWIILNVTALFITLLYVFAAPILRLLGQSEEIAAMAGKFSIWMIPEVFSFAINFPMQKFLQAQSKVMAMAWISFAALVLHVFLSWLCIIKLDMGLVGCAITLNLAWWVLVLGQLAYILAGNCKESWTGFSWLAFTDLAGFVWLSLASAVMLCLEYWCLMVIILLAGLLKNPEIAVDAASICMNVEGWCMMIPFGFTAAISVRVSNELGAGRPKATKFSVFVVVMMSMLIQTIFVAIIFTTRNDFPVIFTDDKTVMEKVSKLAIYLSASIFLSSIQPVLSGVAIGAGWQALVAYVNLGSYYLIGFSLALVLGFKFNLGLEGIWSGMIFGIAVQTVILIVITWRTDWQKEADIAKERISTWGASAVVLPVENG